MRRRMEARMRAICAVAGLLRRWMHPVKTVARRRALSREVVWCSAGLLRRISSTTPERMAPVHERAHERGAWMWWSAGCGCCSLGDPDQDLSPRLLPSDRREPLRGPTRTAEQVRDLVNLCRGGGI